MLNIASLKNKIIDLKSDIHAQVADHICIVETWLDPNTTYNFDIPGRYILKNFVLILFSYRDV